MKIDLFDGGHRRAFDHHGFGCDERVQEVVDFLFGEVRARLGQGHGGRLAVFEFQDHFQCRSHDWLLLSLVPAGGSGCRAAGFDRGSVLTDDAGDVCRLQGSECTAKLVDLLVGERGVEVVERALIHFVSGAVPFGEFEDEAAGCVAACCHGESFLS